MIAALRRRFSPTEPTLAPIRTERLRLLTITPAMLEAETAGAVTLATALEAQVPADWPPEHWECNVWAHIGAQFAAQPETLGWHRYIVSEQKPAALLGCLGGFPCAAGDVELGYSVVNSAQRQGYGSEAAAGLIAWLLRRPEVHSVSAQAFETPRASVRVMQRCGMRFVGAGDQAGTVRYRRWRTDAV